MSAQPKLSMQNSSGTDPGEFRATLVEHLEELRTRLVRSISAIVIGWVIGWIIQEPVYGQFEQLVDVGRKAAEVPPDKYKEVFTHFTQMFMFKMQFSFVLGLVMALPFVMTQIWGFIAPGLREQEKKPLKKIAPVSIGLFFMGASFCWFCLPAGIAWFLSYLEEFPGAALNQQPGSMVLFMVKLMVAFGLGFQLPVIVYGLGAIGLLSGQTLVKYWRHGTVSVFLLSAILTPSNDPLTMTMMAVPLAILFLISIWAVRIVQRKKVKVIENPDYVDEEDNERDDDEN